MSFLLDTNIVSELRKVAPDRHVLEWHRRASGTSVFISTLVIGEIRQGIERLRSRDPERAGDLDRWLAGLLSAYGERILPVSAEVAQVWGRLNADAKPPPIIDGLMAATASVHRLTLVTRNLGDVARTGVPVLNPFSPG